VAYTSEENYNPEDYLKDTLNKLDIGFVKVSNDDIILNHNLTFNKIFGYNHEKDLFGTKNLDYWLNSEERNKFREVLFKNGIVKKYITPAKKLDGEMIFLQITFKLNKNSKGEIISSEGIFIDVSERIKTEQKLKESEEKYRVFMETAKLEDLKASLYEKDLLARIFMDNISGFVVLLRPSTREIIAMNNYAKDMGGIPGLTCYSTIGQSENPCPWCLSPKLWKTGEAQHLVVDALDVTWDTYWNPISDNLYLHYGFDVTDQAKREKNLKELNQIKSQLLRRASHELKTPLVSIKGFTDLLLKLKTEEFQSKSLPIVQEIKDGCSRLELLVNDIILASKLESSQIILSKSLENVSELIFSAVKVLKGFSHARKQKILFDLHEEMFTMLDKDRIQEVLTNIISNAIKYTPKNGTIKLKSKTSKGYFVIMIEDNGIGFTSEEEKNIFTQFGKIERYGQGFDVVSEGSGLGLYIAKKILTKHKGAFG